MVKKNAVVYVQKNAISYATDSADSIVTYPFLETVVKDFEILNSDVFESEITKFFQSNKILPANVAVIYSPATLFSKDFDNIPLENAEENALVKSYLEKIPFEHVAKVSVLANKKLIVYATNEDFCQFIKHALEKIDFSVEIASIAIFASSPFISETQLSAANAKLLLQHFSTFKQHNIFTPKIIELPQTEAASVEITSIKNKQKKSNKRVYLLSGVFTVLLCILGYMLWTSVLQSPSPKKTPVALRSNTKSVISTTITPGSPQDIAIQISESPNATFTATLKDDLIQSGFSNIVVQQVTNSKKTASVTFSQNISQQTQKVIEEKIKHYESVSSTISNTTTNSISIAL